MPDSDTRSYWERRFGNEVSLRTVGWLGLGGRFNAWMYRVRARQFRRLVALYAFPGMRVLDVGSGSGFYVELWRRFGACVAGCDITDAAVDTLRARYPGVPFERADVGEPGALGESARYDAVSAMDVLFHIVDDARWSSALANVASVLRPGGVFVLSDNFVHGTALRAATQVNRSLEEFERELTRDGFEVLVRRPVFALMNTPVDTRNRAYRAAWRATTAIARRHEILGGLAGAMLYPFEIALTSMLREGPSTELMICRRSTGVRT